MEHNIAVKLCNYLIDKHIINQKDADIYVYGLELLFSFISSTLIIVSLGIILNRIMHTIAFLTIFIVLRRFTGGYHANTYLKCKIATITTYLFVLALSEFATPNTLYYLLLLIIGFATIILLGPIENPNKPITLSQRRKNRIISILLFLTLSIISALLCHLNFKIHTVIYYSLLFIILLMIIAKSNSIRIYSKGRYIK